MGGGAHFRHQALPSLERAVKWVESLPSEAETLSFALSWKSKTEIWRWYHCGSQHQIPPMCGSLRLRVLRGLPGRKGALGSIGRGGQWVQAEHHLPGVLFDSRSQSSATGLSRPACRVLCTSPREPVFSACCRPSSSDRHLIPVAFVSEKWFEISC